jgi:hypothetical protein
VFDDRPSSSVDVVAPYGSDRKRRRRAVVRRLTLAFGLVLSFIVGLLLASQL